MYLTRHQTERGPRWAVDTRFLPEAFDLRLLLSLHVDSVREFLNSSVSNEKAGGALLPPLEALHEVWGAGVTYLRSREARRAESATGDIYDRVYAADRPEVFFKMIGWRVVGPHAPIRVRDDSEWNVPEPELTLVINRYREIIGYCVGNDMSSRSIEGENPLYLPQAKIYTGSCAIGPGLELTDPDRLHDLPIQLEIARAARPVFHGETNTAKMNRRFEELIACLFRELDFPQGVFLMTGTGIVPPDHFTLAIGDKVTITIGSLTLENEVGA
jgi:2-dehydro-3-deoxy-D-arabinonate dehydratase